MRLRRCAPAWLLAFVLAAGCSSTPPETLYSGYLSALNQAIRVENLLLFEAGKELPETDRRDYRTTFSAEETRYVYAELRIRYSGPRERGADLSVEWVWSDEAGGVIDRQTADTTIEAGWVRSTHVWSYGSEEAGGFWELGTYRVSLYAGGELLAAQTFRVE